VGEVEVDENGVPVTPIAPVASVEGAAGGDGKTGEGGGGDDGKRGQSEEDDDGKAGEAGDEAGNGGDGAGSGDEEKNEQSGEAGEGGGALTDPQDEESKETLGAGGGEGRRSLLGVEAAMGGAGGEAPAAMGRWELDSKGHQQLRLWLQGVGASRTWQRRSSGQVGIRECGPLHSGMCEFRCPWNGGTMVEVRGRDVGQVALRCLPDVGMRQVRGGGGGGGGGDGGGAGGYEVDAVGGVKATLSFARGSTPGNASMRK
jgi:hypothetical protein